MYFGYLFADLHITRHLYNEWNLHHVAIVLNVNTT